MYAEERQQAISSLVNQRTRVSVTDLADHFGVTTETVRRDLAVLERIGVVRRVHGGAVPASALTAIEPATTEREFAHADQKDRIAKSALDSCLGLAAASSSMPGRAQVVSPRCSRPIANSQS